jgi:hypothetical protein
VKTVDEMSDKEIDDALSEASEESKSNRRRTRRRSKRKKNSKIARGKDEKESWMEPTDYKSDEDDDYSDEAAGSGSEDSGSYVDTDGSESGEGGASETSDLSGNESDVAMEQVQPEAGKEGIRISAKSFGGASDPAAATTPRNVDESQQDPLPFGNALDKKEWLDDGSTGSGSDSDGEDKIQRANLVDRVPATPDMRCSSDTATTDMSTITGVTDPSELFPNDEGKYLFTFTIHLVANRKHKEILIEKLKVLFDYLKGLCSDMVILPKTQSHDSSALPVIVSSDDPHFPSNYGEFKPYGWVNNAWVLAQTEVDAGTLANRRAFKTNKKAGKSSSGGKKKANLKKRGGSSAANDNGPTELYVNLSVMTKHSDVNDLAQSVNIDLGPDEGIYANLKTAQCWKSDAKVILVCVNNQLCTEGVKSTLRETLKNIRCKMCRRGKIDATEHSPPQI